MPPNVAPCVSSALVDDDDDGGEDDDDDGDGGGSDDDGEVETFYSNFPTCCASTKK